MRLCAAAALTAEYMTDRSIALNVPVLEDYLEAFRMRDLCRCTELYAEGAILEFGGTYCRDKPCLERWHRERFASNLDLVRIDNVLVNGSVVPADGGVTSAPLKAWGVPPLWGRAIFIIRDGKI